MAELMVSPHIGDIAFGKLRSYLAYTESLTTEGCINGRIHLLHAYGSVRVEGLSQQWYDNTASLCNTYGGSGLHPPKTLQSLKAFYLNNYKWRTIMRESYSCQSLFRDNSSICYIIFDKNTA